MGGNTAFLAAAEHPDQVAGLVVVEASPNGPAPGSAEHVSDWAEGLQARDDGMWPRFSKQAMVDCIADLATRDYWRQWRAIRCPTLIVRGDRGIFSAEHMQKLAHLLPNGDTVTIPDAGHDVHLEAPAPWARELGRFLAAARQPSD